jgi:hypothetical protein
MLKFYNNIGTDFVTGAGLVNRYYSTKRLTNVERNSFSISPDLQEVIIGCSLGDLHIRKYVNFALLQFKQGSINEAYVLHLYDLFKYCCGTGPRYIVQKPDSRTGKVYSSITFSTYSLPCFNYYHELLYVNGVKRIPLNIGELLTARGLAYWAMDDGVKHSSGFTFCTNSYTLSDVELLIKVLKQNFDLNCTIHKYRKDQYRIYIKADSMGNFRSLVTPYFHSSMMYKLAA